MRRGIFGGTFDPPHVGHLMVASDAFETLALDRLVFVPNARQPLKDAAVTTSAEDRLEMVRRAIAGDPRFDVDDCEVTRGGPSYSVDTLTHFADAHPADEHFFLVGADVGTSFAQWREPRRVLELARLAVLRRGAPGEPGDESDDAVRKRFLVEGNPDDRLPVVVHTRRVDVSSTEVRDRVRTGKPLTGFVVDPVARYITERGLYRPSLQ